MIRSSIENIWIRELAHLAFPMRVLRVIIAIGVLYSSKLFFIPTVRARKYGSLGGSKGILLIKRVSVYFQRSRSSCQVSISPIRIVLTHGSRKRESIFPFHHESHWAYILYPVCVFSRSFFRERMCLVLVVKKTIFDHSIIGFSWYCIIFASLFSCIFHEIESA